MNHIQSPENTRNAAEVSNNDHPHCASSSTTVDDSLDKLANYIYDQFSCYKIIKDHCSVDFDKSTLPEDTLWLPIKSVDGVECEVNINWTNNIFSLNVVPDDEYMYPYTHSFWYGKDVEIKRDKIKSQLNEMLETLEKLRYNPMTGSFDTMNHYASFDFIKKMSNVEMHDPIEHDREISNAYILKYMILWGMAIYVAFVLSTHCSTLL